MDIDDEAYILRSIWAKFCTERNEEQKAHWANLFLFKYNLFQYDHSNSRDLSFMSSVPSQLSCYLLQLVYDIICLAVSSESERFASVDNDKTSAVGNYQREIQNKGNSLIQPATLILLAPSDITAIVSLREFLTRGLGRSILEFLRNCDTQLITCKRELASLLMNLFPSSPWDNTLAESWKPDEFDTFQQYGDSFNLLKNPKQQNTISLNLGSEHETVFNGQNETDIYGKLSDEIKYDLNKFESFQKRCISSDRIAFIIIELLSKLVKCENNQNLGEKSVTLESFQFSLRSLYALQDNISFELINRELLKFKILSLVVSCLNNFFCREQNSRLIDFKSVFMEFLRLLKVRFTDEDNVIKTYQISSSLRIVYLLFSFINNIICISSNKREEIIEIVQIFNDDEIQCFTDDIKIILSYFNQQQQDDINQVVDLILSLNNELRVNAFKEMNAKRKSKKKVDRHEINSNQVHCKGRTLSCVLEKILFKLFNSVNYRLQCVIIRNFEKNPICCCSFTVETIKIVISQKEDIDRVFYKFLQKRILKVMFSKAICSLCETISTCQNFIESLHNLYKEKYDSITKESELINFLKHLHNISYYVTFEISSRILEFIVLPVFQGEIDKMDKNSHTQVILLCLKIFINYLRDTKLVKLYFVNENLIQMQNLIYAPELADPVCTLVKIGLTNYKYIGNNAVDQELRTKQLIDILLTANLNASKILSSMFRRLNCKKIERFLEGNTLESLDSIETGQNKIRYLLADGILSISQVLNLAACYWNFTLELCCLNQQFKTEFYNNYNPEKPTSISSTGNERPQNQIIQFVCNVLSCFLSHEPIASTISTEINNTNQYISIPLSDFSIISTNEIADNNYSMQGCRDDRDVETKTNIGNLSNAIIDRRAALFVIEDDESCESFDEITQSMSSKKYGNNEFLGILKASDNEMIFDIKNQNRFSDSIQGCESELFITKIAKRNLFSASFYKLNSILETSVSFLFGSEENAAKNCANIHLNENCDNNCNVDFIRDDSLKCLQTANFCKEKLLGIFMSSLTILVLETRDKNMQPLLLRQLRNLLLPASKQRWDEVENANAIIEALQALLEVAEMTNRNFINNEGSKRPTSNNYKIHANSKDALIKASSTVSEVERRSIDGSQRDNEQIESEFDISENETEEYYMTPDEGYEADAEFLDLSDSSNNDRDLFNRYKPASQYRKHVVNEGLCSIVIEILIELSTQCIQEPEFWSKSLTQLANRLYVIRNALGGPLFLLKGFASVLTQNDSRLKDFQQSILDLITDLNDPDSLSAYLNILAAENPPIELLVQYMTRVCCNSINVKPSAVIAFPLKTDGTISFSCSEEIYENIKKIRSLHENHEIVSAFTRSACILPIPNNVKPWSEEGFTISMWIELKSNSSNTRTSTDSLRRGQTSFEDTHIISFGTNKLVMSVYFSKTCSLVFEFNHPSAAINAKTSQSDTKSSRDQVQSSNKDNADSNHSRRKRKFDKNLSPNHANHCAESLVNSKSSVDSKEKNDEGKSAIKQVLHSTTLALLNSFSNFNLFLSSNESESILHGTRIESESIIIPKNKWTHLCVAVNIEGKKLNLTILIDGSNSFTFNLPWNGLKQSVKSKTFKVICVGNTNPNVVQCDKVNDYIEYEISSIMFFKKCFNSKSILTNLTALGPDCNHLTYCQAANNLPNYGLLNYEFDWNFNIENFHESLKALRSNLIVSYSAHDPKYFINYSDSANTGKQHGLVAFGSDLQSIKISSIQNATYICGGLSCLLYLFARTVELTPKPDIQANALNILLQVALTNSKLYTEFVKTDFLSLIGSVINTDNCSKGVHLLKTIVNNACNIPVFTQRNDDIQLIESTNACVVHPNLIVNIVRRYSDWNKTGTTESTVLDMLLLCIQELVREKQPHQSYNIAQFAKAGFIKELLNLCKIYVVESLNPIYLSKQSATFFVNILNIFAGAPPAPSLLDEITKLLLILQAPRECYVTDNRSRFYFLLTSDLPSSQRKTDTTLPSKPLRLSLRHRKKSLSASSSSLINRAEMKVSKSDHFLNNKLNRSRHSKNMSFLHDWDSLQSIANCSTMNERKLLAIKQENTDGFPKFLLNLKKQQIQQSQERKDQKRKVAKKKIRKISKSECAIKNGSNFGNAAESTSIATKDYDIVHSDEISSLEELRVNENKFRKFPPPDLYNSPGIIGIQDGLFNLLKDFLLVLPDSYIEEVLCHYVKLEIILVLANHKNCSVRTSILRLLIVVCDRLLPSELQTITKKMFWFHLGNQLALHPADDQLVEACIQWVTRKPSFSIHFEELTDQELKIHNKIGLNPLIAIAAQTIHNSSLAVNTFKVIEHIYKTDIEHNTILIENGLIQTAVKTLQQIYFELIALHSKVECVIKSLLTCVAERSLYSNGHITILWELLNILSHYNESNFSKVVSGFRSVEAHILLTLLQSFFRQNAQLGLNIKFKDIHLSNSNLSGSETRTRFDLLIDRSIQFIISMQNSYQPCSIEMKLFELLISLSLSGNSRCSNLIAWGLSPNRVSDIKTYVINTLLSLFELSKFPAIVCDWKAIKAFLWKYNITLENESVSVTKLCKLLRITENDLWNFEESLEKLDINRNNCLSEQRPMIEKALFKFETCAKTCIDSAMSITRIVADLQNSERKDLMNMMRQYDDNFIYAEWKLIIQRMTHEGAPWHCSTQYPRSWELDDTEGPSRVRNRLSRCYLDIDPKFRMPDFEKTYSAANNSKYPLKYLLLSHDQQINFSFNAQILCNFPAKYLPVDGDIDGELIVTDKMIFFAATYRCKFFYINTFISSIAEIWIRRYQHQENAFEFFINSNKSFFFVVENCDNRKLLKEIFSDKIVANSDPMKLMEQWRDGRLTNWEYLMALNQISGRTYNDLMQYPVFPWILSDYKSHCLDLTQKSSYRKLEKPIAVQHDDNEQHYINNYAYINSSMSNLGTWKMKPYHYSSHYSNSGTVLHFLVRVPRFTNYFLRYQDNNFDIPDRTFHSLNTTWNLASKDSPTDVKELIPEFFCLPEMFENFEFLNFGARQSGEIVNHVTLPSWCGNNARLFVLIHRQALESETVRKNLHRWIDLIFGFKQTGQAAIEAINVFHPATYSEFNITEIADPIEKEAFQTMIKTYGQMPRQLFKVPHDSSNELNYSHHQPSVITSVKGLRWGIFTGSPQLEEAKICSVYKQIDAPFSRLVSFTNKNIIYGLAEKTCIIFGTESDYNLISWHHDDRIVRINSLNDSINSSSPLIYNDPVDEITACGSRFNCNVLWFGHKSGKLTVYCCTNYDAGKNSRNRLTNNIIIQSYNSIRKIAPKLPTRLEEHEFHKDNRSSKNDLGIMHWSGPITLVRHTDEVTNISVSTEFKIAVSVAKDGLAVIWDANSFNYVMTIERPSEIRHSPLNLVAISPTLGDIFTVHSIESSDSDKNVTAEEEECFEVTEENLDDFVNVSMNFNGKSIMRLHSVNGKYVSHNVQEDRILSACYSYIKEGIGVNVIATGFEGGIVKLWSSWDLSLIKELIVSQSDIISVTFSTYQHLVVLTKDDYIQVWESRGLNGEPPQFPQIMSHKGTNS